MLIVAPLWCMCGIVAAIIANQRGESGCVYLLAGMLLGPIGILIALSLGTVCPECQSRVGYDAKVCPKCGHQLKAAESDPSKRKCPFCAEVILAEAIKCRFCGESVPPLAIEPEPVIAETTLDAAPPVEREPIPMLHWLIIFAVGGVILGLIVWNAGSK